MQKHDFNRYAKIASIARVSMPDGPLVVQEKLDGANAGLQLQGDTLTVHSRTRALAAVQSDGSWTAIVGELGSFRGLVDYVAERAPHIFHAMRHADLGHLYGEYLVKHTLDYPEEMWKHFYVFDAVTKSGIYLDPESVRDTLSRTYLGSVNSVMVRSVADFDSRAFMDQIGRPVEGFVLKSYERDARGELDQWGQRYAYKLVLPEFKEAHRNNPMFPAPAMPKTTEQRLAEALPERSVEKVYQKLVTANGEWSNRLFPAFMGMVWQEFFEEHLIPALQKQKLPMVNTKSLKAEIDRKAREYALSRPLENAAD